MRTLAVVPMRGSEAKSRLAPLFSPEERSRLAWGMLGHVLEALDASGAIDHVLVVTRDPAATERRVGTAPHRTVLAQPAERAGLNAALALGREWAHEHGYDAILIIPADLPLLTGEDVRALAWEDAPVVIAPDRHDDGTNALCLQLNAAPGFTFAFGTASSRRHAAEATRLELAWATERTPGLALDLDTPEDWADLPEDARERLLDALREPQHAGHL